MSALKQMIVQCLANNPESSAYFIAGHIGAPLDEVERELQHLACDGVTAETPKLGWARPATHRLAESAGVLKRACAALGGVCECARFAIRNLDIPEESADCIPGVVDPIGDENMGDEAGVPREVAR